MSSSESVPCWIWLLTFAMPPPWQGRSQFSQFMSSRTQIECWAHSAGAVSAYMYKLVHCVEVVLLHPYRKQVVSLWWGKVECRGSHGVPFSVVEAGVVIVTLFRWASNVVIQNFLGNGQLWATGWCCCGSILAPPFQPGFRLIVYVKCTLPALAATPQQWTLLLIN